MSVTPADVRARNQARTRESNWNEYANLFEQKGVYQDLLVEFKNKIPTEVLSEFYRESAEDNGTSAGHFQDRLRVMLRYDDADIRRWLTGRLSFNHLEKAPVYRPNDPKSLLELAIHGDEKGDPLTVDLMVGLALSELPDRGVGVKVQDFAKRFVKQVRGILKLDHGQSEKMQGEIQEAIDEIVSRYQKG